MLYLSTDVMILLNWQNKKPNVIEVNPLLSIIAYSINLEYFKKKKFLAHPISEFTLRFMIEFIRYPQRENTVTWFAAHRLRGR